MEATAVRDAFHVVRRTPELTVLADPDVLAMHTANWILRCISENESILAIALSGGATPARLFTLLAQPQFANQIPWPRIHWFWGDERFVPRDNPRSNFRLAWTGFLSRVPVPESNIHPVATDRLTAQSAAQAYEAEIRQFYGSDRLNPGRPLLHINLLGLGEDGHFASLFPGSAALNERNRWAVATEMNGEARVSMTYPVLESCRHAAFLVSGDTKSEILPRMVAGDQSLPSGRYSPAGEFHVFADRAAAAKLITT